MKINELINRYAYRVDWSDEDNIHIARILELPGVLSHGSSQEDAIKNAKEAAELALEAMVEDKVELPQPIQALSYKGKFLVRTTPENHKALILKAAEAGVSLNQYINSKLASS